MIVLRTLARGVVTHAGVRFTEWLGAFPLLGLGYVLHMDPDLFGRVSSFDVLARWGDQPTWTNVILLIGIARLAALTINGSFRSFTHSPLIRFLSSWAAGLFWTLFVLGVYIAWRDMGGSPTAIVAYGTLTILEARNSYASRADMILMRENADAGPER